MKRSTRYALALASYWLLFVVGPASHEQIGLRRFAWQEGYAAFTVSAPARDNVRAYIRGQEAHHRERDFLAELRELLDRAAVKYDARFLR